MKGGIFLIQDDDSLVEMHEQGYKSEDLLQGLLEKYPNLLAGDQIDISSPRRWLLVSREFGVPSAEEAGGRWSLDHLFLDQDAVPTLVEVKRSNDTRIRREVVGQMLDYAANAVLYWPVESIKSKFESKCEVGGRVPEEVLEEFLKPDVGQEQFWQNLKTNLRAGKIRLVFVADEIPSELRRIIEFLNEQMDPAEVLAVEIRQYVGGNLRTLVPRVIGQTEEAKGKKAGGTGPGKQWDRTSFMARLNSSQTEIAERLLHWSERNMSRIWWGRGKKDGSFIPVLDHKEMDYYPFAVRTGFKNPHIQMQFEPLSSRPPFDSEEMRRELLGRLNNIHGVSLSDDAISRYPSIRFDIFEDQKRLDQFLEIIEWLIREIKTRKS